MDELAIRNLAHGDLTALLGLYRELHPDDDPLPAADEVDRTWRALLADPAQIYLGGFSAGQLVSACNAVVIPNLTRGARPYAVIENVITLAAWRRRGIGAQVMRALLARCWERRCYKVMLQSGIGRADVHAFYTSLGFDRQAKQAFVITAR